MKRMKPQTAFLVLFAATLAASALAQQPLGTQNPPQFAAAQHRCELSADRRMVSLSVSNPGEQPSECTVNCYLPYKGGTATITCTKIVNGKAVFEPLCAHGREKDGQFAKLERSDARCALAPAPLPPNTVVLQKGETVMRYRDWESMTPQEKQIDYFRRR
jgi:hypothetical protein